MTSKLKLLDLYNPQKVEPELTLLLSESDTVVLRGRVYDLLLPLLNGAYTTTEIIEQLEGQVPFLQASHALSYLQKRGVLASPTPQLPPHLEQFCHLLGCDATSARRRLKKSVYVRRMGVATNKFEQILDQAGIKTCDNESAAALTIILVEDYLQQGLRAINQEMYKSDRRWMLVKPVGATVWFGPLFGPDTGCWNCLGQRLKTRRRLEIALQPAGEEEFHPLAPTPPPFMLTMETCLQLAALEIFKWILAGENETLGHYVTTLDTTTLSLSRHRFVRRPQCPICGDSELMQQQMQRPIQLQSRKKAHTKEGGHRIVSPMETLRRYEHHVSPITGMVERLEPFYQDETTQLINTYTSGANAAYPANSYQALRTQLANIDLGKGTTPLQAKVSALCEAVETYSASRHGDEPAIQASYRDLGEQAIHPNACMNFSDRQYEHAAEWNERPEQKTRLNRVPPRFDETAVIEWTPVWSLTHHLFRYVPTSYCFYSGAGEGPSSVPADSNGNASGNTLEEAITQGFMEVAERDGVAIWWYNRLRRPGVDLSSFNDPYLARIQEFYRSINRELWVLDVTTDLGIPTFVAISRLVNAEREDIIFGSGAHFDPRVGILQAITETNQLLSLFLTQSDKGKLPTGNAEATKWWQTTTVENQPYLVPAGNLPEKHRDDYSRLWHTDLKEDALHCVRIADEMDREVLVLDQTRPDVGLNVVKVIVPGLRHFWRRLGPGRLYDVPVKMGWLDAPIPEEELNPFSVFT